MSTSFFPPLNQIVAFSCWHLPVWRKPDWICGTLCISLVPWYLAAPGGDFPQELRFMFPECQCGPVGSALARCSPVSAVQAERCVQPYRCMWYTAQTTYSPGCSGHVSANASFFRLCLRVYSWKKCDPLGFFFFGKWRWVFVNEQMLPPVREHPPLLPGPFPYPDQCC